MMYIRILFFAVLAWSAKPLADEGINYGFFSMVNNSFDLSSVPESISLFSHSEPSPMPNGRASGFTFLLTCLSETDPNFGACGTSIADAAAHNTPGQNVNLLFIEQRTGIKKVLEITGNFSGCYWGTVPGFTHYFGGTGCSGNAVVSTWISQKELKKLPVGGVWKAHMRLQVDQWHNPHWGVLPNTFWDTDITLKVTDSNNIRIWLPQFHGSTANVVMPVMPAYWAFNKPGQVSAEKVIETCLYDGYSSNSKSFEVTLNSNYTEPATQDFLLQNSSAPTSKPLHYQVIASPPGQAGTMQRLKPGVTQTYVGINTANIRQVLMPGLQTPVACVPWPIRIKLLPFDLSRQAAGHYSGTLSIIFTPSLD